MDRPRRDSRQQNGIMLRGLSQLTFATKSANSGHQKSDDGPTAISREPQREDLIPSFPILPCISKSFKAYRSRRKEERQPAGYETMAET
jgi:hypothetical protein